MDRIENHDGRGGGAAGLPSGATLAEADHASKTRFLTTVSHEMLTPLSAIMGSLDLALHADAGPAEARVHIKRANDCAEALHLLIGDMLDAAQVDAGQLDLSRVPVRIRPLFEDAVGRAIEVARANGLAFGLDIDEGLPAEIWSDPRRVGQIVRHLAENAVKFTARGWVRVQASRILPPASDVALLEIVVADSGDGIAEPVQSRLFQPFVQGDGSTTRRRGGAGLGLSLVKAFAEALGGQVVVNNRAGEGTDFRVTLPLDPVVEAPPPLAGASSGSAEATSSRSRILVAEDNEICFAVVESCLTKAGYQVERARDGREAIEAARRADLILMDVEMPNVDGIEATRQIRARARELGHWPVPIIALTAHALQEYRDRSAAAGSTGFLSKPVRLAELLETVARALRTSRSADCSTPRP